MKAKSKRIRTNDDWFFKFIVLSAVALGLLLLLFQVSPKNLTTADPTTNWKTYTNIQRLNYSFKYPNNLFIEEFPNTNNVLFFNSEKDLQEFSNCYNPSKVIFDCSPDKIVLDMDVKLAPTKDYSLDGFREKIETYKNNQGLTWNFFNRRGPTKSTLYQSYLTTNYKGNAYEMFVDAPNGLSLYLKKSLDSTKVDEGYSLLLQQILSTFKFTK